MSPISTSTGRAVKDIINDPTFKYKKGITPKVGFCKIIDKQLGRIAKDMEYSLRNKGWQDVYKLFTEFRRYIEIKEESCRP